ncbi:WG repeat-containing protein [Listeria welshimeri]|uniref:WG repeat-containing protein n=1 Tax=Listeria welshimeri TaxID=1643 RepID=UPI001889B50D|nr:WG repeat-containing protein [Listeria welshimeri]MBF2352691.1 WG repeat-containing protein [Listeria welshimeri]
MNQAIKKATDTLTIKYDKSTQLQGITGSNNQEIAPCIYEEISYVKSLNQFIIKQQGLCGILDNNGNVIVKPAYQMISVKQYISKTLEEGYYIQSAEGFGRINKEGKIIVEPKYNEIDVKEKSFYEANAPHLSKVFYNRMGQKYEGFYGVLHGGYLYKKKFNHQFGTIDQLYNEKLELINDKVKIGYNSRYSYGYMQVSIEKDGDSYLGFIDKQGKIITKNLYDDARDFTKDGIAIVVKDGKKGIINTKEDVIIPFEFDEITDYENGYALVSKNDLWGAIDIHGKLILPIEYDALSSKNDVGFNYIDGIESGFVDLNNRRFQLMTKDKGKSFFYFDNEGKKAPIKSIEKVYPFLDKGTIACYKNKVGLINGLGQVIAPVKYDKISATILGGIGYVKKGNYWAIINEFGEIVTDFKYDLIGFLAPGYCVGKIGNKCTLLSSKGEISENIFDYIGDEKEVGIYWGFGLLNNDYIPISSLDFKTTLDQFEFENVHSLEIHRDRLSFMTNLGYVDTEGTITEIINPIISSKQVTNLVEDDIPLVISESGIISLKNKIGKIPTMFNYANNVFYVEVYQKELLNTMLHYESSFLLGFTGAMMEWALYRVKDVAEERINFNAYLQRIQSLYIASFNFDYLTDEYDWYGGFNEFIVENITDAKEANKLEYLSVLDYYVYKLWRFKIVSNSARKIGLNATEMFSLVRAALPKKYQTLFEEWAYDVLERAKPHCFTSIKDFYTENIPYDQRMDQLVPREFYFDKEYKWDRLENEKRIKAYLKQASIKENPYINHHALEKNPLHFFE